MVFTKKESLEKIIELIEKSEFSLVEKMTLRDFLRFNLR